METQVQNNVKNKQTKTREEKNVHERRSKKKNGTKRLSKSSRISEKHVRPHELLYYTSQLSHEGEVNTLRGIVVLVFTTSVG